MEMLEMLYPDKILRPGEGVPGTHASMVNSQPVNSKNQLAYDTSRSCLPSSTNTSKEIIGVDELLANAGYKVRASELTHVAQRLEQLENALGAAQDAGISHLSTDAVHYNPSDLAGWIECMLEELTPTATGDAVHENLYNTSYGMAASSTSMMESEVLIRSPMSNQLWQPGPHPCTAIAREFPHEVIDVHSVAHGSGFKDKGIGGIFGGIYSAEQLGLNQEASTKQGPRRFPTGLPPEKHNINPIDTYSASVNEKSFHVNGVSDLIFANSHEHNQDSIQQSHRQFGPSSQQANMTLDGPDSAQESGIRLVHLLLACAESIQRNDLVAAEKIVREIRVVAGPQSGPMKRVATQFVEALERRIYGLNPEDNILNHMNSVPDLLHFYYESCPFLRFAHFTANQAILQAFENHRQVHVIDFNLMHGLQWPPLIQALALRPGGPPFLRITCIGPPQLGGNDILQEIGSNLAQLAKSVNVEFDFQRVVVRKLDDVKPWMLQLSQGEAVAVNSILQLHRLVYSQDSVVSAPVVEVLQAVRSLNPRIVTIVEQEANHNSPIFIQRFVEALHYYSAMFDSFEASNLDQQGLELMLAERYLGREICNIVACEGVDRVERHETLDLWRIRMCNAGFQPLHLGSNAFKHARMLLTHLCSGEGYVVEENGGCLTLGWQSRPLIAASAWQCC